MGALTSNRKRGNDFFSLNYKTIVSNFDHISKKIKLSASINHKSTVERFFKYPVPIDPIRRGVHAPCRQSRFVKYKDSSESLAPGMGNLLSRKYDEAKKFDTSMYLKNGKEMRDIEEMESGVLEKNDIYMPQEKISNGFDSSRCLKKNMININDDDTAKEGGSKDSSVEEVEAASSENKGLLDGKESNLKEESIGKKSYSLASNPRSGSCFSIPLSKRLLSPVEKISARLKLKKFQIKLYEKCLETIRLLRPLKKEEHVKKDLITEPFVPLTKEEKAEVFGAWSSNRRKVLVAHENSNIDITGEILQCLKPRQWLNDEVINLYLELLKEREKREPQKFLKCHFFNTFFYKKLVSGRGGYNYQSVRRWTSQRKLGYSLFECDKIFVPIHKQTHWCLAVINKKDNKFQYLDSLGGRDSEVLKALARYFVDEVKDKSGEDIDVSSWKLEFVEDLPEQKNGFDCGVFMIKYADFYSRDIDLCFNQDHILYFRMRTAKELLKLKAN